MNKENTTLFELTGRWLEFYEMADDPEIDPDVFFDTMEGLDGEYEDKADSYAFMYNKKLGEAEYCKSMAAAFTAKAKAKENAAKRIKDGLFRSMMAIGKTKIKTALWSFSIRKNAPAVVLDTEISKIPPQYLKYAEPTVDKKLLKDDIINGEKLDGIAHLEASESLIIK